MSKILELANCIMFSQKQIMTERGTKSQQGVADMIQEAIDEAIARPGKMKLNARQLGTVLAALRYWQREGLMSSGHEHDIATDDGEFEPLSAEEIDALCEDLNCS